MFLKALLVVLLGAVSMAQMYGGAYGGAYGPVGYAGEGGVGYGPAGYAGYGGEGYYGEDYKKPLPYKFGYKVHDPKYGSTHHREEVGDGAGGVKGSYGYTDPKGIFRQVDYVADKGGFRASVKTNEPGTAKQHPAHVSMQSPY